MIKQINSVWWFKLNGILRLGLLHSPAMRVFPLYLVNEYPKSGGTWVGQMLSKALDVPFPRNRLPIFRSCIMHGHYLSQLGMKNVLCVWRDGRDVLVSQYYHYFFPNERGNKVLVNRATADLQLSDIHDIKNNLPLFIAYTYKDKWHPKFTWTDFVNQWHGKKNVLHVKYEDLRQNCVIELQRIVLELTRKKLKKNEAEKIIEEFSFEKQSGRQPGQENSSSFMRKGIVGDWKKHFSYESKKMFDHYAGGALIALGYETDHSWAER